MKKTPPLALYIFLVLSIFIISCIVLLQGCSAKNGVDAEDGDQRIIVYTSFYTMYDFTGKIGGDKIRIKNLVPSGIGPHHWEPSPKDMASLEKADLLIYNGAGMESWIDKVLASVKSKKLVAVEASKGIELININHDEKHDHHSLGYDPHVWLNPLNAVKQMETIKNALQDADPENSEYYENNYLLYKEKLEELDNEFKEAVKEFNRKEFVVAHEAFGYLCQAYGLEQVPIEGLNADSEPTPSRMAEITKFARENDIRVIFFEELLSPKVAEAIAREINAETAVLNPLEGLKEEDIKAGKDYFSVMRENLEALKKALIY